MSSTPNPELGHRIRAAGFDTNYHDQGNGHPVVMIHGSGPGVTAWANWRLNIGVNSSSVQMTRLGHKGYPLVLFCRNLTEARAAMCAELFSMFR